MKKLTTAEFIAKAKKKHGNRYDYSLVEYTRSDNLVIIICKKHGEFRQTAIYHSQGSGCPKCKSHKNGNRLRLSNKEFITIAKKIHGNKYDYSKTRYFRRNDKVTILCKKHGKFQQLPGNHIKGSGCSACRSAFMRKKLTKTTEHFIKNTRKVHGNKYDYSKTKYCGLSRPVLIICKKHGEFQQNAKSHLRGCGCPSCKSSKGEIRVLRYLRKNKIKFMPQKTFVGCKAKRPLPFDFYLTTKNICIEYDGAQHFKSIKAWGGVKSFKKRLKHDGIKTNYCRRNRIKLLRISYENINNIESILHKELR